MATKIQVRRDTTANWTTYAAEVPAAGEFCYDTDAKTLKIGDGVNEYRDLNVIADADFDATQINDNYVEVSGDNMTGDLTIGPDGGPAVTTLAADGSAEFAGTATFGDYDASSTTTNGVINSSAGIITVQRSSAAGANSDIFTAFQQDNRIARLGTDADLVLGGDIEGAVATWTPNIALNGSDGSADFAGVVKSYVGDSPSGAQCFAAGHSGLTYANINNDGSAEFAGEINVGNYNSGDSQSGGIVLKPSGQLVVQADAGSKESPKTAIQGYETSSSGSLTGSWNIKSDGSAEFAGPLTAARAVFNHTAGSSAADKSFVISTGAGANRVVIGADGSAEFAGTVQAGNINIDSDNNLGIKNFVGTTASVLQIQGKPATANSQEAIQVFKGSTSTWSVNYGGTASFSNAILNLEPDNPANYVSTTDSEGNQTQVYNGPTLDVKERLTKTDELIQQLRSAVQNSTTFDGLRAAMAVALDDYVNPNY